MLTVLKSWIEEYRNRPRRYKSSTLKPGTFNPDTPTNQKILIYWSLFHDLKKVKEKLRDIDGVKASRVVIYSVIHHAQHPESFPSETYKREFMMAPTVLQKKLLKGDEARGGRRKGGWRRRLALGELEMRLV
ncbi:MAG: hypothetical protein MMC33_008370 [Icmadophila ericetorum]|nr:hypothetical protein [Icmadophila ericetorum]